MSTHVAFEQKFSVRETVPKFSFKWDAFEFKKVKSPGSITKGTVENQVLKGTHLSSIIDSEAGQWKNRQIFIEQVVGDVLERCPKDEPLVIVSFGADRQLMEYLIGAILLENGFQQTSFLLVDPAYVFSEAENLIGLKNVLKDFREGIESVYNRLYKEPFSQERIRYLSRSQNIAKYFPDNANVVVIEGLPPYAETIKEMRKYQVKEKKPEELMIGSHIVLPNQANSLAFIPSNYIEQLKNTGANFKASLPLAIFQNTQSKSYYFLDWGCKIQADGHFYLSFSGEEDYFESLGLSRDRQIKLKPGEMIQVGQLIPTLKKSIENTLDKEIKTIQGDNPKKQLSQENLTALLEKVKQVANSYFPSIPCFFLADYVLDRAEALAYIASHAGHHYRKRFSLEADVDKNYKISMDEIK